MKNTTLFAFLLFALVSCNFVGGKRVKGNGNIRTEERKVSSFNEVEVHGAIKLYVSQGDLKPVKIEADENLMQYVVVEQDGDRLTVKPRDGFNLQASDEMKVYVTSPVFKSIDVSGACDILGQTKIDQRERMNLHVSGAGQINMNVHTPEVEAQISGSGTVRLKGETKKFDLGLSGAAKALCYDLLSENTRVDISGAGDAEVYASEKLDAEVSGAGNVSYKGDAPEVNQKVSGAGSVNKKD
ncbi:MAG TPA: head GIN domain-containing protein [Chitinophagaceae bacterium]|jgi:hypothetical protein|nr:head GIN domain-containing protein [Chitinophagaceae bacterium]